MSDSFTGQQINASVIRLTAAQWAAQPYVLPLGVLGVESDTLACKIGDGETAWGDLGYSSGTSVITEPGTSLTLGPEHNGAWIRFTSGSAVTVTFPQGLGVAFGCLLKAAGTGIVTIERDGTSSIVNVDGLYAISGQYGIMTVFADEADVATVSGNLA